MEDPTTHWVIADAINDSGQSPLWAWVTVALGAALVAAGGLFFTGGDRTGAVHDSTHQAVVVPAAAPGN